MMPLLFYHFTAASCLPGIQEHGIRWGIIPAGDPFRPTLVKGYQWLTVSHEWLQAWDAHACGRPSLLTYNRNDYRITVQFPRQQRHNLRPWQVIAPAVGALRPELDEGNGYDPQNWWLYQGVIRPCFFSAIDRNPALPLEEAVP